MALKHYECFRTVQNLSGRGNHTVTTAPSHNSSLDQEKDGFAPADLLAEARATPTRL